MSPQLIAELERALTYPKLRRLIPAEEAKRAVAWLAGSARIASDAEDPPPVRREDPDDDYLLALAAAERAVLATGDRHLLALADTLPIHSPVNFLVLLEERAR